MLWSSTFFPFFIHGVNRLGLEELLFKFKFHAPPAFLPAGELLKIP
jgi:hypothetical protein